MENLSETMKAEGISLGMCEDGIKGWHADSSQQELIDKFKEYIDFCQRHDWPSCDFIKTNFDRELLRDNLVFVDEEISLANAPSGIFVVNGSCTGTIRLAPWSVATIYLRHDSDIRIEAGDFSRVFVRLYDNAKADVGHSETAIVKTYDRRNAKKKCTCSNLH